MKTKPTFFAFAFAGIFLFTATTQSYAVNYTISFTASGVTSSVGSVQVKNVTKGTTVTVQNGNTLSLTDPTALNELSANNPNIQISKNASTGKSVLTFYARQTGTTQIDAYAIDGRKVMGKTINLESGYNAFELSLPTGMYAIHISGNGYSYSTKLQSQANAAFQGEINFQGTKKTEASAPQKSKATVTSAINMPYTAGDKLLYTATSGTYTASVPDVPSASKTINFVYSILPASFIPAGTFTMGSSLDEVGRSSDETQHQVTLSTFRMSMYEITNTQYAAFLNAKNIGTDRKYAAGAYPDQLLINYSSGSNDWGLHYIGTQWVPATGYEASPVINVSWYGAMEYATYAGGTLPTEAQWEYACRAGTTTPFSTGNYLTDLQANYNWSSPYNDGVNTVTTSLNKTQPVSSYVPNAFGLYNMHGNLWEWCSDWYGTYPATSQTNPTGAATGTNRVRRGGNWGAPASYCRSATRYTMSPGNYSDGLGFRIIYVP